MVANLAQLEISLPILFLNYRWSHNPPSYWRAVTPDWSWTHTIPKIYLRSSWIAGSCHCMQLSFDDTLVSTYERSSVNLHGGYTIKWLTLTKHILIFYLIHGWSDTGVIIISNKEMKNYVKSTYNQEEKKKTFFISIKIINRLEAIDQNLTC